MMGTQLWSFVACVLLAAAASTAHAAAHCGPLTKELLQKYAKNDTVLISVIDKIVWKCFGPSWVENIRAAGISYWLVAALDPETSMALAEAGVEQCFNAPQDRLTYKGSDKVYQWGGNHWTKTTWNKVHVMQSVYELGFHIVHSDADVIWLADPLPFFMRTLSGPAHIVIGTDAVLTSNGKGDAYLEAFTNPHANINTGVYFFRNWAGGLDFFKKWLWWEDKDKGHDQDGFNYHVRGKFFHGDPDLPEAPLSQDPGSRIFYAAHHNVTAISFLPASMFANTYTWVNARLWEKLDHPLYEVHLVWGGSTLESKRQNMRDAMKFHDETPYYSEPNLLSFDLDQLPMPEDYNKWPIERTEDMIRFHVTAANHQLRQVYYAFALALMLNRTLVMPRFQCYCSKNWYQTQACRVNHETASTFPFVCSLSQLMRVKLLEQGSGLPPDKAAEYIAHKVFIREYSFLENPKVPNAIKESYLVVAPSAQPRPKGKLTTQQMIDKEEDVPAGQGPKGLQAPGKRLTLLAPLADYELRAVLEPYASTRVMHFPQPNRTVSGFAKQETQAAFDLLIQSRVTHWCCRSPPEMKAKNLTERVQLAALPVSRYNHLPELPKDGRYSYQHHFMRVGDGELR